MLEAELASLIYSRGRISIPTIGVTGTDGKTTTSSLISHILKEAGYNPAMVTTVAAQIGDKTYDTGLHTTTPSAFALQKYIKKAADYGCDFLVLEITSHALDQNRTRNIDFKIGVLTNITHEHLDYHGTYEKYVKVKSKLFKKAEISILNLDDDSYELIKSVLSDKKIYTYSLKRKADFTAKSIGFKEPSEFEFNSENFLAAVSAAKVLGIEDSKIKAALKTFKFPSGRQEIVYQGDFKVIVDFAHTPNSFKKVLSALKKTTNGRLIHVFGSAGQRDKSKRPLMGKVAGEIDDVIILTSEDPRSENVDVINKQIRSEMQDYKGEIFELADRQIAINFAIQKAQKGDTVVLSGKGHEKSMNLGRGETSWSEHEAVKIALIERDKSITKTILDAVPA